MNALAPNFGVVIIGDEILSGKRRDGHLARSIEQLGARGLELAWAEYVGDDRARIAATLRRTLSTDDVVFSFGGIGATPDDYTRAAAADAAGVPLTRHPEGIRLLEERFGDELTEARLMMVDFPQGAAIIPNPFNRIPGFSIGRHYFLPGFPEMAWPMQVWVLETYYSRIFHQRVQAEESITIDAAGESDLLDMMNHIVSTLPSVKLSSLPRFDPQAPRGRRIDFSLRGDPAGVAAGMAYAKHTLTLAGYVFR